MTRKVTHDPNLSWLLDAVWGTDDETGARGATYRVIPNTRRARMLVPDEDAIAVAALRAGAGTRSARAQRARSLAAIGVRAGVFRDRVRVPADDPVSAVDRRGVRGAGRVARLRRSPSEPLPQARPAGAHARRAGDRVREGRVERPDRRERSSGAHRAHRARGRRAHRRARADRAPRAPRVPAAVDAPDAGGPAAVRTRRAAERPGCVDHGRTGAGNERGARPDRGASAPTARGRGRLGARNPCREHPRARRRPRRPSRLTAGRRLARRLVAVEPRPRPRVACGPGTGSTAARTCRWGSTSRISCSSGASSAIARRSIARSGSPPRRRRRCWPRSGTTRRRERRYVPSTLPRSACGTSRRRASASPRTRGSSPVPSRRSASAIDELA